MDQPYMTMQVIRLIQLNYRKCISEKMQKVKAKSSSTRRPPTGRGRRK